MKKLIIASAIASAFAMPAFAQTAAPAAEAAPASPHTLTANVGVFSSYRFRGIDQTFGKPALQGGIDYAHESGFYVGNWNSNVSSGAGFPDGNLEMDFYGGYKASFGDFGIDVGGIVYYYPGTESRGLTGGRNTGTVTNKELYIGGSWKFLSLKYFYSVDDYFSLRGWDNTGTVNDSRTRGTSYLDFSANYDLGDGWGINGHVGHLAMKNGYKGSYTDWKLGVTKDISGWVLAASYIGTNAAGNCDNLTGNGSANNNYQFYCFANSNADNGNSAAPGVNFGSKWKDAGRGTAVISVSRTF